MPRPLGGMAVMSMDVLRRAEMMQARAARYIEDQYNVDRQVQDLEGLAYEDFIRDIEQARARGEEGMKELNQRYAKLLLPLIEQVLQPEEEGEV